MRKLAIGVTAFALCSASQPVLAQSPYLAPHKPLWEMAEPMTATLAVERLLPVKSYGPSNSGPKANGDSASNGGLEFGESEQGALGCVVGGVVGTAGAIAIGGENIVNLIAGGLVPVANSAALYAALTGVVFATFCAVGQSLTPLIVYSYRKYVAAPDSAAPAAPGVPMVNNPPVSNSSTATPSRYLKIAETR